MSENERGSYLLQGFTPWQIRITAGGILGAFIAVIGAVTPWLILVMAGVALAICCLLALILLGNRQSSRELAKLRKERRSTQAQTATDKKPSPRRTPLIGPSHEYATRIRKSASAYETFALRSRSLTIRDPFAVAATNGRYDHKGLMLFVSVQRMKMLPSLKSSDLDDWDPTAFLSLARILANQRGREDDLENAVRMFSFAEAFFGSKSLSSKDQLINLEALGELKRYKQQLALARRFNLGRKNPNQLSLIELNRIHSEERSSSPVWIDGLSALYRRHGFSPVTNRAEAGPTALDSLETNVHATYSGPLVSVIVPTFQGGPPLLSALKSLLNQTWLNLEIIVVDDGSESTYHQYLQEAADLSPKIKIIYLEKNMGAYHARNAGLRISSGDYITVHDDDDWSHGDKIAVQITRLLNDTDAVATMSSHVRVTEDLKFLRINSNPTFTQVNYSSLMFSRKIIDDIGMWDEVRRGADAEFRDRIVARYGQRIRVHRDVPLSFTRTWDGSLTAGEISRGFLDSSRRLYATAYAQWHKKAGTDGELLRPAEPRNFPLPSNMSPGQANQNLRNFDVVFMTDYRFPGGTTSLTLQEIEASAQAGYRVGYIHAESPINGTTPPIAERLFELQLAGKVEQLSLKDKAAIKLLVIRHPSVVTFMDQAESQLEVNHAVLIVNNPPVLSGGSGMVFDLEESIFNVDRIFGVHTMVVPESGVTRNLCIGLVPERRLHEVTWPGFVDCQRYRKPDFTRRPVLGRHSRDHYLKWPSSRATFDAVYKSQNYDTVLLGGTDELVRKLGSETIHNITVHEFGALDAVRFLEDVDFWAYYHDEMLTESFGMSIAEALAAGKVVILPPYLEESFGEGALYAEPTEVEDLVIELWHNPEKYQEQSERAVKYTKQNISSNAFLARLKRFINTDVRSVD